MFQTACKIKGKKKKKRKMNQLTGWHFWEEQVEFSPY